MQIGLGLSITSWHRNIASTTTTSALGATSGTQWDDATSTTVTGTGFTASSVVYVDGTPVATTYDSATQLTFTIPAIVFAVAGGKAITVDGSNSQIFTVNSINYLVTDTGDHFVTDTGATIRTN